MKICGWRAGAGWVLGGVLLLAGAHDARAGDLPVGPMTVHAFSGQLKGALQGENKNEDDVIVRGSRSVKAIAEECLERKLEKHEKVVLVTDCGDVSSPYSVSFMVLDTSSDPATILDIFGGARLDEVARTENKDDETTQAEFSLEGGMGCNPGFTFGLHAGFAKAAFKPLDPKDSESRICMQSANGKALGTGAIDGDPVVLESVSFNAGARSSKIEVTAEQIIDFFESN